MKVIRNENIETNLKKLIKMEKLVKGVLEQVESIFVIITKEDI